MKHKSSSGPQYLTNPLPYRIAEFDRFGNYRIEPKQTVDFTGYATKKEVAETMERSRVFTQRVGNATVELMLINSPNNTEGEVRGVFFGWGGNFHVPVAELELTEIARRNPGVDILVVNNPASGVSSPIPRSAIKKMKKTGSFSSYGEVVAQAVDGVLANYDDTSFYGHSMGARTAISTAANLNHLPSDMYLTDPPGSRRLGMLGIARSFMMAEGAHAGKYAENSDNLLSLQLQAENDKNTGASIMAKGLEGALQFFLDQPLAMSRAGLLNDLSQLGDRATQDQSNIEVQINAPEFSEINRFEDVISILSELSRQHPHLALRMALLLGQTHSVNVGGNSHTVGALAGRLT